MGNVFLHLDFKKKLTLNIAARGAVECVCIVYSGVNRS